MTPFFKPTVFLAACWLMLIAGDLHAQAPAKIAFTGGRIIPVTGPEIPSGTILVEDGRITAIGADVKLPYDAMEVDCEGQVLFPGMVHPHSADGLDRTNENLPVTPYLDVRDALDPSRLFFEESLRNGVTTVHVIPGDNCVIGGISRAVRPIGRTPAEMTTLEDIALKVSTSPKRGSDRMLQMQILRETFRELVDYRARVAERKYEASLKEKDEVLDVGPEEARKRGAPLVRYEDLDDAHCNLARLVDGRLGAFIYAGAAMDVGPAIRLAESQGFLSRSVLVLGTDSVRAVKELKEARRPVVLPTELVLRNRDVISGEVEETFLPKVLHDAGVTFALQPSPNTSLAERYLTYQAARCVREGLPRRTAYKAITLNPAKMLGLGDQLGSLEVGKIANIVVFSGDPLEFDTWVEQVYVEGILAYERSRDPRIQDLLPEPPKPEPKAAESDPNSKPDDAKPDDATPDDATPDNAKPVKPDSVKPGDDTGSGTEGG